jgi:hypothetical protein
VNNKLKELIRPMFGKPCCKKRVWRHRSLCLGFEEKFFHEKKLIDDFYAEWEIRTYYCAWRVIKDKKILCASSDAVDSIDELDAALKQIEFGCIESLDQFSDLDIRVKFDTGIIVEFLATISDEDECFHIS